jgi:hypothetical protein
LIERNPKFQVVTQKPAAESPSQIKNHLRNFISQEYGGGVGASGMMNTIEDETTQDHSYRPSNMSHDMTESTFREDTKNLNGRSTQLSVGVHSKHTPYFSNNGGRLFH